MSQPPPKGTESGFDLDDVLDAASDLVIHDGFDALSFRRLSIQLGVAEEDVARTAGSVEQMLVALLNREFRSMYSELIDNIERDPLGGRLSRIYRYVLTAVYERPLARALYLTDRDALHRMLRATNGMTYIPQLGARSEFIDVMKGAGVVRADADSTAVSAVISAVCAGTALTAPNGQLDDIADGLALLLERSVDTAQPDTSAAKAIFVNYAMSLARDAPDGLSTELEQDPV